MVNLTKASRELFSRTPDERFSSFDSLLAHCQQLIPNGIEVDVIIKSTELTAEQRQELLKSLFGSCKEDADLDI